MANGNFFKDAFGKAKQILEGFLYRDEGGNAPVPSAMEDQYPAPAEGVYAQQPQTVTYTYKKYNGRIVDMTVNYLKEGDPVIGTEESEAAERQVIKLRSGTDYNAPIRSVEGMKINIDKFPLNDGLPHLRPLLFFQSTHQLESGKDSYSSRSNLLQPFVSL